MKETTTRSALAVALGIALLGAGSAGAGDLGRWDRDQDRRISAQEARDLDDGLFEDWDANNDDILEATEFHAGVFETLDTDDTGRLERTEFDNAEAWGFEAADFASWDTNGNGTIERNEFDARAKNAGAFAEWDRNRDSRLDADERQAGFFRTWDRDRDGYLDAEEWQPIAAANWVKSPQAQDRQSMSTTRDADTTSSSAHMASASQPAEPSSQTTATMRDQQRTTTPDKHGTMADKDKHDTMMSDKHGTMMSDKHGTMTSDKQGTMASDKRGTMASGDRGSMPSQNQGTTSSTDARPASQKAQETRKPELELVRYVSVSIPVVANVTPGQIAATPAAFYGTVVAVEAEVEEVFGRNVFTLDEERLGAGPDVLVVAPRAIAPVAEGTTVTVIGHVRPLIRTELDRDYDWFDPKWFQRVQMSYDRRPVIIATSIISRDGRDLLPAPSQPLAD